MDLIIAAVVAILGTLGFLFFRKTPSELSHKEIEREREKALVEDAIKDLDSGIEKLREDVKKEQENKTNEEIEDFWKKRD